jgi:hypothetical protein
MHLKSARAFAECVLRYGPQGRAGAGGYFATIVSPDSRQARQCLQRMAKYFSPFTPNIQGSTRGRGKGGGDDEHVTGEFQGIMDEEAFDFVL